MDFEEDRAENIKGIMSETAERDGKEEKEKEAHPPEKDTVMKDGGFIENPLRDIHPPG